MHEFNRLILILCGLGVMALTFENPSTETEVEQTSSAQTIGTEPPVATEDHCGGTCYECTERATEKGDCIKWVKGVCHKWEQINCCKRAVNKCCSQGGTQSVTMCKQQ